MEHNGIQYTVVQTANPLVWRWMVRFEGCAKIGTSPNRIGAVQHAIRAIDDAIGTKSSVEHRRIGFQQRSGILF
jgi:hypothetical protein